MTEKIIRVLAEQAGIDLIGFFSVEPLKECLPYLIRRHQEGFSTGFEGGEPEDRINYLKAYPDAKTGIVIGINNYQAFEEVADEKYRVQLASVSWGEDYHRVLKRRMTSSGRQEEHQYSIDYLLTIVHWLIGDLHTVPGWAFMAKTTV
jgi:epoxyqueuosine reductase